MSTERWNIGLPGGPSGPFYSIVSESGRVIAMQIPSKEVAEHIIDQRERIRVLEQWKEAADTLLEEVSFGVAQWGIKNVPPVPRRWLERVEGLRLAGEKLLPESPAAASGEDHE